MNVRISAFGTALALVIGPATLLAQDLGEFEQAHVCADEYTYYKAHEKDPGEWYPTNDLLRARSGKVAPAACKAEVDRRAALCKTKKDMQDRHKDLQSRDTYKSMTLDEYCLERGYQDVMFDFINEGRRAEEEAQKAAAKAEADAKRQAQIAATEAPTAKMKNAALEKAVKKAFEVDWGEDGKNKVLKVWLFGWDDELETDAFGRVTGRDMSATVAFKAPDGTCHLHYELWLQRGNGRSFSGPLTARGAGSKEENQILCEKLEPAKASKAAPKKK